MNIRFSPFRKNDSLAEDLHPASAEPVPNKLVVKQITKEKPLRKVTIVHPEPADSYRIKSRLLNDGHRHVETFFLPESFVVMYRQGYQPDVIFVHDFIAAEAGMTGPELARSLRMDHKYKGLLFSTSHDHLGLPGTALEIHGFSGNLEDYFSK